MFSLTKFCDVGFLMYILFGAYWCEFITGAIVFSLNSIPMNV